MIKNQKCPHIQSNIMTDYSIFPIKTIYLGKYGLKIRNFWETWFSFTLYWFNFRVHLSLSVMSSTKNTIYFALSLCLQQKSIYNFYFCLISCVRPLCNEKYEKHNFYRNMLKRSFVDVSKNQGDQCSGVYNDKLWVPRSEDKDTLCRKSGS